MRASPLQENGFKRLIQCSLKHWEFKFFFIEHWISDKKIRTNSVIVLSPVYCMKYWHTGMLHLNVSRKTPKLHLSPSVNPLLYLCVLQCLADYSCCFFSEVHCDAYIIIPVEICTSLVQIIFFAFERMCEEHCEMLYYTVYKVA